MTLPLLVTGIAPLASAIGNLGLFISFLGYKALYYQRVKDGKTSKIGCGCFATKQAHYSPDALPDITVSTILVGLSSLHVWLSLITPPTLYDVVLNTIAVSIWIVVAVVLLLRFKVEQIREVSKRIVDS